MIETSDTVSDHIPFPDKERGYTKISGIFMGDLWLYIAAGPKNTIVL